MLRVCASPTFPCMLSHLCAFDHVTSACVCLKDRMAVNNDITSASVNHSPPPTEQEVVRARRRKQEHQEWKRSVFAPAGWWACEQEKRRGQERRAAAAAGERTVKQSRKGWKGRRYQRMEIRRDFLWSVFPCEDPYVVLFLSFFYLFLWDRLHKRKITDIIWVHTRWASSSCVIQ